jgi:hypothetical protein
MEAGYEVGASELEAHYGPDLMELAHRMRAMPEQALDFIATLAPPDDRGKEQQ